MNNTDLSDNPLHPFTYLWKNYIQYADIFVIHPVVHFRPSCFPIERTCMIPATMDPLDGLNKPLDRRSMMFYFDLFRDLSRKKKGPEIAFPDCYIIQIARFDPSKGFADAIDAYAEFRLILDQSNYIRGYPKLLLCGNAAIDDPDGLSLAAELEAMLDHKENGYLRNDVLLIRLPPGDQMLNALLSNALCSLQLSTHEGYEMKVTESISKGVPVIAYASGGIPLQIQDGVDGFLVECGDKKAVAQKLFQLVSFPHIREKMSKEGIKEAKNDSNKTVSNAIRWLRLSLSLSSKIKNA